MLEQRDEMREDIMTDYFYEVRYNSGGYRPTLFLSLK
jgi:hypothetical protein